MTKRNNTLLTRRSFMAAAAATVVGSTTACTLGGASSIGTQAADGEALAFRNIRYGHAERFGPAKLVPFSDDLIQSERGPVSPQSPSRLAISMGPPPYNRQDENCQVLSVFTPSREGKRPVIAFIHGGAFVTGGGEQAWYDGNKLAEEQDVVVVNISYRLGALGFWLPEGSTGMSPAYTDQVAALEWIQANIDQFGGDASNVTLCGQSAGAISARGLMDWGYGQKLFHRVIAQSGWSIKDERPAAEAQARLFDSILGADPYTADYAGLLKAQAGLSRKTRSPGWKPVAAEEVAPINVDVLTGWTREDRAGQLILGARQKPTPGTSLEPFRKDTQKVMAVPTSAFARDVVAAGQNAYVYSFDWNGPDTGMGNTHCIDLPFLFGDWESWSKAPMLAGVSPEEFDRMGRSMRAQWAAFAKTGNPGSNWKPATASEVPVNSIT